MWKEFRTFVARGNFVDLAVGVVIGAAFTTVVNSFVRDLLMPLIGLLTGGIDFSELYINLSDRSYETLARATEAGTPRRAKPRRRKATGRSSMCSTVSG